MSPRIPVRCVRFLGRVRCAYSTSVVPPRVLVTPELSEEEQTKAIELRTNQAPNRKQTWAKSQRPRSDAFNHPKFEGAILEMQVIYSVVSALTPLSLDRRPPLS